MTLSLAHLNAHYYRNATNFLAHQRLSDRAMLDQALERMDVMRDDNEDVVMEGSGKLIRQLLEIEADAANGSSYTASSVRRDEDDVQDSAGKGCGELRLLIPYLGTIKITRQGPISREPLQESAASRPYQTPQTEFPYVESTRAALNDACASVPHASPATDPSARRDSKVIVFGRSPGTGTAEPAAANIQGRTAVCATIPLGLG
ncbi:hypothetical protein V1515DRAFT_372196 [Lipomyces mesembrius]